MYVNNNADAHMQVLRGRHGISNNYFE